MTLTAQAYDTDRHDLKTVDGVNPGIGNQFSWSVPTNVAVHIIGVTFRYQSLTVSGIRRPYVAVTTGGVATMNIHAGPVDQADGMSWFYYFSPGVNGQDLSSTTTLFPSTLSCAMRIKDGEQLVIRSTNFGAADVLDNIRIRFKEWKVD